MRPFSAALPTKARETAPAAPPRRPLPGLRPLWLVACLLTLASCFSLPGRESGPRTSGELLGWKVVVEKREPNLLLAVDQTECVVPENRFDRVREGQRVFCHWRMGG